MGTKKSKRRQMATLLCSLGAIAISGLAADALAAQAWTNGVECWELDNQGRRVQRVVHCTGTTVVTSCGVDANGNVYGECGQRNGLEP